METAKRNQAEHLAALESIELSLPHGWTRPFWTVAFAELWCSWIVLAWGAQMIYVHASPSMEPVSRAIYQLAAGRIPLMLIAVSLLALGIVQLIALYRWHKPLRQACLIGAFSFFLFVSIAFWRSLSIFPGAFICPTYAVAMAIRFVQLRSRRGD